MNDPAAKPEISYPCPWTFKVVGTNEDDLRRAVKVMLEVCLDPGSGERDFELGLSRTSSGGKYLSLNLTLEVTSEEERDALYAGLKDCPEVLMVL
ncbi:DUF493 domain-containing protein [bacterium]|nr:MAG: DUF493 domain-containing protein [bacterium]